MIALAAYLIKSRRSEAVSILRVCLPLLDVFIENSRAHFALPASTDLLELALLADILFLNQNYNQAAETYEASLAQGAGDSIPLRRSSKEDHLLKLHVHIPHVHANIVLAHMQAKQQEKAERALLRMLQLFPKEARDLFHTNDNTKSRDILHTTTPEAPGIVPKRPKHNDS